MAEKGVFGGAPEGNTNREKLRTRGMREVACEALCRHLTLGRSMGSFPMLSLRSIKYYREKYPDDFPEEQIEESVRAGALRWEQRVGDMADQGNIQAAKFAMHNILGWSEGGSNSTISVRGAVEIQKQERTREERILDMAREIAFMLSEGLTVASVRTTIIDQQPNGVTENDVSASDASGSPATGR